MTGLGIPAGGLPFDSRPLVRLYAVIPLSRGWEAHAGGRSSPVPALALLSDGVKSWLEPMPRAGVGYGHD